jgi:predicted O-linked N-acetylglucosamine transferase (SPINDLY family)
MSSAPQRVSEAAAPPATAADAASAATATATTTATARLDTACRGAMDLQMAGRLEPAEQMYRAILHEQPAHAAAHYGLGMLEVQRNRAADALPHLLAALEAQPQLADYWLGYLEALLLTGQSEAARAALALARRHGLAGPATEEFAARLAHSSSDAPSPPSPPAPPARTDRRRAQRTARQQEAAMLTSLKQGRLAQAQAAARALTERHPERGLAFKTLGALLWADGHTQEALSAMQTSAALLPQDAEAHSNLGSTLNKLERHEEAEMSLRRALQIDPGFGAAHAHLADTLQLQGRYQEAESSLRRAIALAPEDLKAHENIRHTSLLFLLSHDPDLEADALFAEHCRIGAGLESRLRSAGPALAWPRHANPPDPERRLRIGWVSGDFCNHAVTSFIEPILAQLKDRPGLELYAYYNNPNEDAVTSRLRGYMQHWRAVSALPDRALTETIMRDGIDVLIDLSGHTSLNRLRAFARKPAPIQVSWIGYPGTTGLRAMDYYLVDRHFLPPGQFDRQFTEKLVYLPTGAPFQPDPCSPPIGVLPALARGRVNFGSFNRVGKINRATVALWSQLLHALPDATMLIAGIPAHSHPSERLIEWFAAQGIHAARLQFHARCNMDAYLALHHQVDICLDTIPYSGGTTSYHAYWMGVPTLTVAGSTPASRQGAAIMNQVGLEDFVAANAAQFVRQGVHWAGRLGELDAVRQSLRARWQNSPMRGPGPISDALEQTLRHMWRRWCGGLPPESFEVPSLNAVH